MFKMTFKTALDGSRTRVTRTEVDGEFLFEEYGPNPTGAKPVVARSFKLRGDDAQQRINQLTVADNIRFLRAYSANPHTVQSLASGRGTDDIYARPLPGTAEFDVQTQMRAYVSGSVSIGEAVQAIVDRVTREVHGEVAHHLSDVGRDTTIAELSEFYGGLANNE